MATDQVIEKSGFVHFVVIQIAIARLFTQSLDQDLSTALSQSLHQARWCKAAKIDQKVSIIHRPNLL